LVLEKISVLKNLLHFIDSQLLYALGLPEGGSQEFQERRNMKTSPGVISSSIS
jgi:hypothetical protein